MAKKEKGGPTVTAGTLKLSPKEAEEFQAAIVAYRFKRPATFLRLCAEMIIQHHKAGDQLAWPLLLRVAKTIEDPKNESNTGIRWLSDDANNGKPQENLKAKKQK